MIEYPVMSEQVCFTNNTFSFLNPQSLYSEIFLWVPHVSHYWQQRLMFGNSVQLTRIHGHKRQLKNVIPLVSLWKPHSLTTTRTLCLWLSNRTYTISISSEQHVRSSREIVKLNCLKTAEDRDQWTFFFFNVINVIYPASIYWVLSRLSKNNSR